MTEKMEENLFERKKKLPFKPFDLLGGIPSSDNLLEYSSLFSTDESKCPKYLLPYKDFIDNVLDIPEETMKNLNQIVTKRENDELLNEKSQKKIQNKESAEENKITNALDAQVNKLFKKLLVYVKLSCPVKIPFKSTLSADEHRFYLRSFIKFQIRRPQTKVEHEEFKYYESLQPKVFDEQRCLMNFSYKVSQIVLNQYNSIPEPISSYLKKYVEHRCPNALSYSRYYRTELKIPLKPIDHKNAQRCYSLKHCGHLLSLGYVPHIFIPCSTSQNSLPLDDSVALKKPPDFKRKSYKLSEDPNADLLAKKHNVKVVMTASAFKTIVDNEDLSEGRWDIPVIIKCFATKDHQGKHKLSRVVYIDKPLPKKSFYPLQMKNVFFRKAAEASLIKVVNYEPVRMKTPLISDAGETRRESVLSSYEDDPFGSSMNEIETFASPQANISKKKEPNRKQNNSTFCASEECDDSNLVTPSTSSLDKEKDSKLGGTPLPVNKASPKTLPNDILNAIISPLVRAHCQEPKKNSKKPLAKPWSRPLPTKWDKNDKIEEIGYGDGCNYHYELYSITSRVEGGTSLDREEPLKILIRHRIHGLSYIGNKVNRSKAYVMDVKVENQVYFGCEVHFKSEIARQWASLAIRPNTYLLHIRACVESGRVVITEEKTLDSIINEGKQPHICFNPGAALASMNVVLSSLCRMSTGNYLLHRDPETVGFYSLMKDIETESEQHLFNIDLHQMYSDKCLIARIYNKAPWQNIDTHVITPFHLKHKKIPATFPMENAVNLDKKTRKKIRRAAERKKDIQDYVPYNQVQDEQQKAASTSAEPPMRIRKRF